MKWKQCSDRYWEYEREDTDPNCKAFNTNVVASVIHERYDATSYKYYIRVRGTVFEQRGLSCDTLKDAQKWIEKINWVETWKSIYGKDCIV